MASSLKIVCGSQQLNLNDRVSFFMQRGYYPSVLGIAKDEEDKTLTETVTVQFRGDAISANVQALNRWFEQARRNDPAEDKVYIEYKIAEGEDAWRSRIYDGVIEPTDNIAREWPRKRVNVDISFERDCFWEGPEQVLPIGNVNNGYVFNCNDGATVGNLTRTNALYITGNMIEGDLPTPCCLEITNTGEYDLGAIWIGVNNTRANWFGNWMLEAENAIGIEPYAISGASGGAIARGSLTFGQALPILRWNLSSALVNQMRGQRVRLLLRPHFLGAYPNFKYKIKVKHGVIDVYETDWIRESEEYGRHWLDMFDLRLPPWLEGHTSLDMLVLELYATPTRAGTWNWAFDDVMIFPQDSFVEIETFVAAYEGMVVIDGDKGWASNEVGGDKFGLRKMVGSLMLKPRAGHTFLFAMHGTYINQAPIDMSLLVTGKYRPRRLTL